ncbi:dual specificity protein phosphatase-like protein [Cricetibacter osteomyelitidis]|uniref:Dual specificity protein phosphatase-like protein n=1 Tax=Cricetibacter osteomyelitidis TaxID=1521931 RepID=A0A4R2SPP6_9PAST|nr:dual specificity protein phosphatase family protein [Cricetibacter osteomyelitidis]TCP92129.1 dual specificity protein phosphatase-like protein [Cricetibacter osteomyelitidis]
MWLNIAFWLKGKAKVMEIKNGVFIGSVTQAHKFATVVDLCAEYPCRKPPTNYQVVPMLDMVTPDVQDLVQGAIRVEQLRQEQTPLLVCCALGYGRSAAVMLVWLAVFGGCENLSQAVTQLRTKRPNIVLPLETEQAVLSAIAHLQN